MKDNLELDFFVVGAQKSGTTTVHEYLRTHPKFYLPIEKETRFFTENLEKGKDWYLKTYYEDSNSSQLKGEVCPDYMMSTHVPAEIKKMFPDAKIIFCIRNPIDRAYSHYKMSFFRGKESRTFEDAIKLASQKPDNFAFDRNYDYLGFGEYGRIIGEYLNHFSYDSIHVVFFDDLASSPEETVGKIVSWLGADSSGLKVMTKKVFNESKSIRFELFHKFVSLLQSSESFKNFLSFFVSRRRLRFIAKWAKYELNTIEVGFPILTDEVRLKLHAYYKSDIELLEGLISQPVPWPDFEKLAKRRL